MPKMVTVTVMSLPMTRCQQVGLVRLHIHQRGKEMIKTYCISETMEVKQHLLEY